MGAGGVAETKPRRHKVQTTAQTKPRAPKADPPLAVAAGRGVPRELPTRTPASLRKTLVQNVGPLGKLGCDVVCRRLEFPRGIPSPLMLVVEAAVV